MKAGRGEKGTVGIVKQGRQKTGNPKIYRFTVLRLLVNGFQRSAFPIMCVACRETDSAPPLGFRKRGCGHAGRHARGTHRRWPGPLRDPGPRFCRRDADAEDPPGCGVGDILVNPSARAHGAARPENFPLNRATFTGCPPRCACSSGDAAPGDLGRLDAPAGLARTSKTGLPAITSAATLPRSWPCGRASCRTTASPTAKMRGSAVRCCPSTRMNPRLQPARRGVSKAQPLVAGFLRPIPRAHGEALLVPGARARPGRPSTPVCPPAGFSPGSSTDVGKNRFQPLLQGSTRSASTPGSRRSCKLTRLTRCRGRRTPCPARARHIRRPE